MKAERFNIIMENLETRITEVSNRLDRLTNKNSYKQLTVADLEDMAKFFPKEQSLMDKIIKVELYHILGADLSPVQQSQLISRIRKYTSYRSDVKRMANWVGSGNLIIGTHPAIPTKSEYQLSILGDFKLEYGVREGVEVEDAETISETNASEAIVMQVPTIVSKNKLCTLDDFNESVSFNLSDAPAVASFFHENVGGFKASSKGSILTAMTTSGADKFGIKWLVVDGVCTGTTLNSDTYKNIKKALA